MLSKKNRLVATRDFSKLFSKGRSVSGRGIGLKFVKNNKEFPRIGFVVSTKISKRAVVRNLIKRRMREASRPLVAEFADQGIDVALMARNEAIQMTFKDVQEVTRMLFEKAGIIRTEQK